LPTLTVTRSIDKGFISIADPDLRPEAFLTSDPGFGMEKNPDPGTAMNIPDYISRA
jgi:hypothetical protein